MKNNFFEKSTFFPLMRIHSHFEEFGNCCKSKENKKRTLSHISEAGVNRLVNSLSLFLSRLHLSFFSHLTGIIVHIELYLFSYIPFKIL